ncbi:hypothetical protein MtrunA17_Chr4g0031241 [Medicago truncatula]|uniref:Transmembrane protein n=1 Tax=Medicago truncatula TaxID=3880 RepID=A0A396I5M3_MEDTR|nr:hypothetical protein MtrunA17_Chr4g0031241 [Medicago truncatula]
MRRQISIHLLFLFAWLLHSITSMPMFRLINQLISSSEPNKLSQSHILG